MRKKARKKASLIYKKPVHKRILLHPFTILLLIIVGILLVGWTLKASGVSYVITANVPATSANTIPELSQLASNSPSFSPSVSTSTNPRVIPCNNPALVPPNCKPKSSPNLGQIFNNHRWLWLAWPFYAVVVIVVFSFWLGEKQELINLSRLYRKKR